LSTKHIIGHIGDGFYGSDDPADSDKALKEVVFTYLLTYLLTNTFEC